MHRCRRQKIKFTIQRRHLKIEIFKKWGRSHIGMSLSAVYPIKSQAIALDESKIERHPVKLESLELALDEADGFSATLKVKGYDWIFGNVATWDSRDVAEREFQKMVEAVAKGQYKIDLYEGGRIKMNIQY